MSWYCVDLLCNASRNSSARIALINTYNFIPSLSRLLGDQLTDIKKKKLLKLMQVGIIVVNNIFNTAVLFD